MVGRLKMLKRILCFFMAMLLTVQLVQFGHVYAHALENNTHILEEAESGDTPSSGVASVADEAEEETTTPTPA